MYFIFYIILKHYHRLMDWMLFKRDYQYLTHEQWMEQCERYAKRREQDHEIFMLESFNYIHKSKIRNSKYEYHDYKPMR